MKRGVGGRCESQFTALASDKIIMGKIEENDKILYNKELFEEFRKLNFLLGEYVIAASGALAVRGIREAKDIDVVVSEKLWNELKNKYEVKNENDVEKIIPAEKIEIFWEGSFDRINKGEKRCPIAEKQISRAEIINGFAFQNLRDCLWFKANSSREKDKKDLLLVKEYFLDHPEEEIKIDFEI